EDVDQIPIRPVWQLGDYEERRTRQTEIAFRTTDLSASNAVAGSTPVPSREVATSDEAPTSVSRRGQMIPTEPGRTTQLSHLLDRRSGVSWIGLVLIAALLWWTGASQVAALHQGLMQVAGFAIAAGGFWRIGRYLGGWEEHEGEGQAPPVAMSSASLVSLGLAGGLVPCWDAVGLVVLSAALGRLAVGVMLVIAFGAGMAVVLVGVGLLAARLKSAMLSSVTRSWESQLGLLSGLILAGLGLVLFVG